MSITLLHNETDKLLIPELRFKEFEDLWKINKLGDLGSIVNGLTYSPDDIDDNGTLVLRSSNVQNGALYLNDNVYVIVKEDKYNPVLIDDILICVRNGSKRLIGKNTLITEEVKGVAFGAFMAVYRSDFNRFLYYFFSSQAYYKEIHKNLGATINSINGGDLRKFKVGVPSLPEQQKIASFLSEIDEKKQQLTKKKALLEQYKKGVMQQLFSGQLRFKDENGNLYPDWEEKKIGDFLVESRIKGDTGDKAKKLTVKLWGRGVFAKTDVTEGSAQTQYFIRKSGQFIYSKLDFLNCAFGIVPEELGGLQSTVDLPCFDFKNEINSYFLLERVKQRNFYKKLGDQADGSRKAKRIHAATFCSFSLETPCLLEQQKIATYLSKIDEKIENVNQQITQTQTFKKGLLQQMFVAA